MREAGPFSRRIFLRSLVRASILFSVGEITFAPSRVRADLFSLTGVTGGAAYPFPHQYVMLVFADRCTNCGACVESCRRVNNLSDRGQRITILNPTDGKVKEQPFSAASFLPMMCNQCTDPPCVRVCPTKASSQNSETGLVGIDRRLCIGCRACMVVCPYMARYYDYADKAVDGCDFCYQSRLKNGRQPACVEACPQRVLYHGDLLRTSDPVVETVEANKGALWLMRSEKGCRSNVMYVSKDRTKEG